MLLYTLILDLTKMGGVILAGRLFRDLGIPSLIAGIVISNLHYVVLLVVTVRFFFADSFPSTLDRALLLYILFAFMVNFYVKRRKIEQRKQLILKARARRNARDGDKVG